jgi:DNA mismatch endonuclease (patch repair protein)
MPKNNSAFWTQKLARTKERDAAAERQLNEQGWRVIRFWEHEIKANAAGAAERVVVALQAARAGHSSLSSRSKSPGLRPVGG